MELLDGKEGTKRHRLTPRSGMECAEGFGRIQWPRRTLIVEGFVDLGADGIFLDGIVMYGPALCLGPLPSEERIEPCTEAHLEESEGLRRTLLRTETLLECQTYIYM